MPSYLVAFSLDSTKSISLSLSLFLRLSLLFSRSPLQISQNPEEARGITWWKLNSWHPEVELELGGTAASISGMWGQVVVVVHFFFFTASATWLRMHSCGVRWSLWAGKDSGAIWARLRQRYWFPSSRSLNHSRKTGDDVGEEKWGWTPVAKALASGSLYRICSFCVK